MRTTGGSNLKTQEHTRAVANPLARYEVSAMAPPDRDILTMISGILSGYGAVVVKLDDHEFHAPDTGTELLEIDMSVDVPAFATTGFLSELKQELDRICWDDVQYERVPVVPQQGAA